MNGLQRHLRREVMKRLKATPAVTALVSAGSIYGQTQPAEVPWPFIRMGPPQTTPIVATCIRGGQVSMLVHAFAKPRKQGALTIEAAEDHAGRIGEAIESALHLAGIDAEVGGKPCRMVLRLSDMRLTIDGDETDAFHYSAQINARILAE